MKEQKRIIGFATGVLFKEIQSISNEAIRRCLSIGEEAIELTCLKKEQIPQLWNIDTRPLKKLKHVSIHMPTDIIYEPNNQDSINTLELIKDFCKDNRDFIKLAIFHPDCIADWEMIARFSQIVPVAIENMDNRKEGFRDEKDLNSVFSKYPNLGLVFDLNHWISNKYSKRQTLEFMCKLQDNLREIHLSGYWEYHDPLIYTQQTELIVIASESNPKIPIIIESVLKKDQLKLEFDLVSMYLY